MEDTGIVLLVEDDENILRINRRILEREGFTVLCAETIKEARDLYYEYSPDALVLDIMLPDGSGITFCEEIRPFTPVPVLFLTALDEKEEVIQGLAAGGNDYITKPYDVDVLVGRVKAQINLAKMNRQTTCQKNVLVFGPLILNLIAGRVYLYGKDMLLTQKEYALLFLLMQHREEVVSGDYLYQMVWNQPMTGDSRTLKKHLSNVRKKLEEGGAGYTITAIYGKGYCIRKMK